MQKRVRRLGMWREKGRGQFQIPWSWVAHSQSCAFWCAFTARNIHRTAHWKTNTPWEYLKIDFLTKTIILFLLFPNWLVFFFFSLNILTPGHCSKPVHISFVFCVCCPGFFFLSLLLTRSLIDNIHNQWTHISYMMCIIYCILFCEVSFFYICIYISIYPIGSVVLETLTKRHIKAWYKALIILFFNFIFYFSYTAASRPFGNCDLILYVYGSVCFYSFALFLFDSMYKWNHMMFV